MSIEKLKNGNKIFVKNFNANKNLYNDLVVNGQHPKILWVGCSDSRVVPEFIVNAKTGDLFVTRNIANIVPPKNRDESNSSSVLEYAVKHLEVKHIVICGHTGCGGITAMMNGVKENSNISNWLDHAKPAKKNSIPETIKANVLLQSENLLTFDYIEEKVTSGYIIIHKWLYDLKTGIIDYYDNEVERWIPLK